MRPLDFIMCAAIATIALWNLISYCETQDLRKTVERIEAQ